MIRWGGVLFFLFGCGSVTERPDASIDFMVTPTNLSFGDRDVHDLASADGSFTQSVTVTNVGAAASFSMPVVEGFSFSGDCGASLPAGASCSLDVTFKPSEIRSYDELATLGGSDISLQGAGGAMVSARLTADPTDAITLDATSVGFNCSFPGGYNAVTCEQLVTLATFSMDVSGSGFLRWQDSCGTGGSPAAPDCSYACGGTQLDPCMVDLNDAHFLAQGEGTKYHFAVVHP